MSRFVTIIVTATVFVAAFLAAPDAPPGEQPARHPERSGAMQSLEFRREARRYPQNDLPRDNYFRAFEWARTTGAKGKPLPSDGSGWAYIGPSNLSGRMLAVEVNPQNPNTIYAGSASGGLWRSYTGGVAGDWERITTGYPVLGVAAIAIDPTDSNVIYIGTGEVYRYGGTAGGLVIRTTRGSYGMGILKTTDGGITWTKSLDWSYNQERGVQAIRLNPLNPSSVWTATTEGIFRSVDGGGSWTNIIAIEMAQDIEIHPADTLRILASAGNLGLSNLVVKTTDGGAVWTSATPTDFSGKTLLAQYGANPEVVYASVADSTTGVGGLWRTDDFGDSWTELSNSSTNAIFGVQGWYSHFVAVHPEDSTIVFHAGVPASRSSDGGITFSGAGGTYSDHHAYAYDPTDPDILYVANDDGIYRSTNFGQSFTQVSDNLGTGQFYNGFSNSASDSLIALGQVQDHIPGYLYTGSTLWPFSAVDEVGWTAIDQSNDFIMYAGTRNGGAVRKSTNRGVSFGATGGGFSGLSCWNAPFVVSPSNPNVLYFGRSRIFRSTNAAASWTATNGGLELDGNPALSMGISASDPNVVYVGTAPRVTRTHVFRTTDGGTSWADVTGPLPDRYPLDIAVDPNDPAVAYVGYGGAGSGHAFKTTDAGGSWSDITGTLPDIPVTAFLVDPLNSSVVYLGSDIGVYLSTNAGGSWASFGDGLPEAVLVSDLTMTPSNRTLRAATHGNSIFERKMPSTLPGLSGVLPGGGESWEVGSLQTITWFQTLLTTVEIDYSTDNGATWLAVSASVPAWPDTFQWTVPPTLTAEGRVRVRSATDTLLNAQSAGTFSITYDGVILDLAEDWNLVSVPIGVPDLASSAVFPGAVGVVYRYGGAYLSAETLETGPGYWIKLAAAAAQPLGGDSVTAETVAVAQGWALVGSLTAPVPVSSLVTDPVGLIETPFYSYGGSYAEEDTLRPGRGHWVKMSGPGIIILDADGPSIPPASAIGRGTGLVRSDDEAGSLRFTDALGRSARLTVADYDVDASRFQLPPIPPAGGFDIRFKDGSLLAMTDGSEHAIRHQGVRFPLRVAWDLSGDDAYVLSTGADGEITLSGSGSAEIRSATELTVRRRTADAGRVPGDFTLRQNYPNPFNPSTVIGFTIPPAAGGGDDPVVVSLRVYDIGGRLAATLVEKGMAPGEHNVVWDAGELPGGVYFGVLRSGVISRSMKMLLVK